MEGVHAGVKLVPVLCWDHGVSYTSRLAGGLTAHPPGHRSAKGLKVRAWGEKAHRYTLPIFLRAP